MNYTEAVDYIHSFINYERSTDWSYPEAFKLDRMRGLAKALGNPQDAYACVIIAGSKGKGSTASFLSNILRMENLKVGLYTSPHLWDVRERIQVNGLKISEMRFVDLALRIRKVLEEPFLRKNVPTYFEVLTAMAFCHFKDMKIHLAVLEVGLGGLYDSTNIAKSKVVGITPISLEHTDKLGKTVAKIAVQKCGIIKGRESVVSAPQPAEADAVIEKCVKENDAKLLRVGKDIRIVERSVEENKQVFDLRSPVGGFFNLEIGLLGRHQIENAAQAVGLAKCIEERYSFKISDEAIKRGLLDTQWPGRLEKLSEKPLLVFDGAQNPASMQRLLEALPRHFHFDKLVVVLGISSDKDLHGILTEFAEIKPVIVATQSSSSRALPAKNIEIEAREMGFDSAMEEDPREALKKALKMASDNDMVLVTGSLFLLANIKEGLEKSDAS